VKEASLDAFDFLIVVFLNVGKFFGKNDGPHGKQEPDILHAIEGFHSTIP